MKLNEKIIYAIIDTGATKSVLNDKIIKDLNGRVRIKNSSIKLASVTNNELMVEGACRLGIHFPGKNSGETKTFHHSFIIVKNLPVQAILGNDFLRKYNCKINYGDKTIEMEKLNEKIISELHENLIGNLQKINLISTKGEANLVPIFEYSEIKKEESVLNKEQKMTEITRKDITTQKRENIEKEIDLEEPINENETSEGESTTDTDEEENMDENYENWEKEIAMMVSEGTCIGKLSEIMGNEKVNLEKEHSKEENNRKDLNDKLASDLINLYIGSEERDYDDGNDKKEANEQFDIRDTYLVKRLQEMSDEKIQEREGDKVERDNHSFYEKIQEREGDKVERDNHSFYEKIQEREGDKVERDNHSFYEKIQEREGDKVERDNHSFYEKIQEREGDKVERDNHSFYEKIQEREGDKVERDNHSFYEKIQEREGDKVERDNHSFYEKIQEREGDKVVRDDHSFNEGIQEEKGDDKVRNNQSIVEKFQETEENDKARNNQSIVEKFQETEENDKVRNNQSIVEKFQETEENNIIRKNQSIVEKFEEENNTFNNPRKENQSVVEKAGMERDNLEVKNQSIVEKIHLIKNDNKTGDDQLIVENIQETEGSNEININSLGHSNMCTENTSENGDTYYEINPSITAVKSEINKNPIFISDEKEEIWNGDACLISQGLRNKTKDEEIIIRDERINEGRMNKNMTTTGKGDLPIVDRTNVGKENLSIVKNMTTTGKGDLPIVDMTTVGKENLSIVNNIISVEVEDLSIVKGMTTIGEDNPPIDKNIVRIECKEKSKGDENLETNNQSFVDETYVKREDDKDILKTEDEKEINKQNDMKMDSNAFVRIQMIKEEEGNIARMNKIRKEKRGGFYEFRRIPSEYEVTSENREEMENKDKINMVTTRGEKEKKASENIFSDRELREKEESTEENQLYPIEEIYLEEEIIISPLCEVRYNYYFLEDMLTKFERQMLQFRPKNIGEDIVIPSSSLLLQIKPVKSEKWPILLRNTNKYSVKLEKGTNLGTIYAINAYNIKRGPNKIRQMQKREKKDKNLETKDEKLDDEEESNNTTMEEINLIRPGIGYEKRTEVKTEPINETNRGYTLLKRMGWKENEGLGKKGQGRKKPIPLMRSDNFKDNRRKNWKGGRKKIKFKRTKDKKTIKKIMKNIYKKREIIFALESLMSETPRKIDLESERISLETWKKLKEEENSTAFVGQKIKRDRPVPVKDLLSDENVEKEIEEIESRQPWVKEIDIGLLTESELLGLYRLLEKHQNVFSKSDEDIGLTDLIEQKIVLDTDKPIRMKQWPIPYYMQDRVKKELEKMERMGIIEPSDSVYNTAIFPVIKKSGDVRLVNDMRPINSHMITEYQQTYTLQDFIDMLSGKDMYSTLDLTSGFYQLGIHEDSRKYTAFLCLNKKMQYTRVVMGMADSPITFQGFMNKALNPIPKTEAMAYLDDILVSSVGFEQQITILDKVFTRLGVAKLKLKPKKCQMMHKKCSFLGHVISKEGMTPCPTKVEAILKFTPPKTLTGVQSFIGFANFYNSYIPEFSKHTFHLRQLIKEKTKIKWSDKAQRAWNNLRELIVNAPILAYPRLNQPFILSTDASKSGVGSILSQVNEKGEEKVISFFSKALTESQMNKWPTTRKELFAISTSLKKFRNYVKGTYSTIYTDHQAIESYLNMNMVEGEVGKMIQTISEYKVMVIYKPARLINHADALSRSPQFIVSPPTNFANEMEELLPRIEVDEDEIEKWRKEFQEEMDIHIQYERFTEEVISYSEFDKDCLYKAISLIISGTTKYMKNARTLIYKHTEKNRSFIKDQLLSVDETDRQHLNDIIKGEPATGIEIRSLSGTFKSPIVITHRTTRGYRPEVVLPETTQVAKIEPPKGLTIYFGIDEFGNYIWTNKNLSAPKKDESTLKINRKREEYTYGKDFQKAKKLLIDEEEKLKKEEKDDITEKKEDEDKTLPDVETLFLMNNIEEKKNIIKNKEYRELMVHVPTVEETIAKQTRDDLCKEWIKYVTTGEIPNLHRKHFNLYKEGTYMDEDGILKYRNKTRSAFMTGKASRIWLPKSMILNTFQRLHDNMSHIGKNKTLIWFNDRYIFPGVKKLLEKYIKNCTFCLSKKGGYTKQEPKLTNFQRLSEPGDHISIDLVGPFPRTERGNKYLMTIMDTFSRYATAIPLQNGTALEVANALVSQWISIFGVPSSIYSDRGSNFVSKLFKSLCEILHIKYRQTLAYKPSSNAKIERSHGTLVGQLRCIVNKEQDNWDLLIPLVLMSYRNSVHQSIGNTPSYVMMGRDISTPMEMYRNTPIKGKYGIGLTPSAYAAETVLRMRRAYNMFKERMINATEKYNEQKNEKREDHLFSEQDVVLLKRPLTKKGLSRKLHRPYKGPYRIVQIISPVTCKIQAIGTNETRDVYTGHLRLYDGAIHDLLQHWSEQDEMYDEEKEGNLWQPNVETYEEDFVPGLGED